MSKASIKSKLTTYLLPICLGLLISEVAVRLLGYQPFPHPKPTIVGGIYEQDALTGWQNKPGRHVQEIPDPAGRSPRRTEMGVNEDGTRFCPAVSSGDGKKVVFVGDSFLQGGNLNDQDVLSCKLQKLRTDLQISNFGTGGYGTCQTLLRMRQLVTMPEYSGATFVYGLNDFHEDRNIASPLYAWRMAKASASQTIFMPYCSLTSSGKIKIHPADKFSAPLSLDQYSSVLTLLEEAYYTLKSRLVEADKGPITDELLLEMQKLATDNGQRFLVLIMDASPERRAHYLEFLKAHEIQVIDGFHPQQNDQSMRIPYDSHPNEILHDYWAKLLAEQF